MFTKNTLEEYALQAYVPDQLLAYVQAVSPWNLQSQVFGNYILHSNATHAILIAYDIENAEHSDDLETCLAELTHLEQVHTVSILAPRLPKILPPEVNITEDAYYFVDLPLKLTQNAKNMCKNASLHMNIQKKDAQGAFSSEHHKLMLDYVRRHNVSKEMASIFQHLESYCNSTATVRMYSAFARSNNALLGFALADFSSWRTAFYMFGMRLATAPPGVSDILLLNLLQEAEERGYTSCNLGLGINDGIRFFKCKWGGTPTLPFVQCSFHLNNEELELKETKQSSSFLHKLKNFFKK